MSVSAVSSSVPVSSAVTHPAAPVAKPAAAPQDTVSVSAKALAGAGDVDHDGDSH